MYEGPCRGSLAEKHNAERVWRIDIKNRFGGHGNIGCRPRPGKEWDNPFKELMTTGNLFISIGTLMNSRGSAFSEFTNTEDIRYCHGLSTLSHKQ